MSRMPAGLFDQIGDKVARAREPASRNLLVDEFPCRVRQLDDDRHCPSPNEYQGFDNLSYFARRFRANVDLLHRMDGDAVVVRAQTIDYAARSSQRLLFRSGP